MDLDELEKIIALLKNTDIAELELEKEGVALRLRRGVRVESGAAGSLQPCLVSASTPSAGGTAGPEEIADAPAEEAGLIKIESPIVGSFYRRPSPDAEAFVEVGSHVKKGDTLCIVEAMKLMNEIESTVDGTIEKISLKDGEVVEFGEVLFLIRPD
jgi:acetyl-CoA carboxylase biotin carboxyl carrier protein